MARDQIAVRTPQDREREQHEAELLERIRLESANPLQVAGEKVWDTLGGLYSDYLYSSGVLLLLFSMWAVYPPLVRYRHAHIKRYRRDQLVFRRWFFNTVHMPKWNKKYLQRIVIPPPLQPQEQPDLYFTAAVAEAKQQQQQQPSNANGGAQDGAGTVPAPAHSEPDAQSPVVRQAGAMFQWQGVETEEASPFAKRVLSSKQSAKSAFHNAFESESARLINKALLDINETVYSREGQFKRDVDPNVDLADVKSRVEWAVQEANACVVLREDHTVLKSIPPGWEVWWVSAEEQQRRNTCKLWIMGLAFCRAMQDLLDMPEMPQMIQ